MSETAEDRISSLPEDLLHHIHSFLYIKDGARTSVLSKRWNYIWKTVPILDLRSSNYYPTSLDTEKFMDFVDGSLHRHNSSNVDTFLLRWYVYLNETRVHSWISTVIRGNVRKLSLDLAFNETQSLYIPSIFTCESLTSLELGLQYDFTFPENISFPRLKRLKLSEFRFSDECWNEGLFSNSPVLEELILELCIFCMTNFSISIPTLKILEIQGWDMVTEDGLLDCALKIHAPNLVTLTYLANVAKEYILSSFLSLVEAVVRLTSEKDGAEISQLLRAIAHAKCLTVNDLTLQALCSVYDLSNNLLAFHNVKMLSICNNLTADQGLIALLKAVPNLESLVFDEYINDEHEVNDGKDDDSGEDDSDDTEGDGVNDNEDDDADSIKECDSNDEGEDNEDDSWALDSMTTGCLFPHLKSICFQRFAGNSREMRWVKLILRNAKALQNMTIHYEPSRRFVNTKSEKEVMEEIPSSLRASAGCVFNIYSSWE